MLSDNDKNNEHNQFKPYSGYKSYDDTSNNDSHAEDSQVDINTYKKVHYHDDLSFHEGSDSQAYINSYEEINYDNDSKFNKATNSGENTNPYSYSYKELDSYIEVDSYRNVSPDENINNKSINPNSHPISHNNINSYESQYQYKKKSKFFFRFVSAVCTVAVCFGAGYLGGYLSNERYSSSNKNIPETNYSNTDNPNNSDNNISNTASADTKDTDDDSVIKVTTKDNSNEDEYTLMEIAEIASKSVVEITTESLATGSIFQQYITTGAGSGVIITGDGYIITNNHVIENANNIMVKLNNDDTDYKAELIGADVKTDVAVIKINKTGLSPASFGDSGKLKVGQGVVAIGNPLGSLGGTVTDGIISALDRAITIDGETMRLLQTNAAINRGNSGGGLFNMKCELIGVVNAKSSGTDVEGLGFGIPSNIARDVAEDLMNHGYVRGRVRLGMTLLDITDTQIAWRYRVQNLGLYISKVENEGSTKGADLQSGDRIVSVDGKEINNYTEFMKIMDGHSIGDTLTVVVERGGGHITCSMTLQEYKPN